jgi:hypothetical protein
MTLGSTYVNADDLSSLDAAVVWNLIYARLAVISCSGHFCSRDLLLKIGTVRFSVAHPSRVSHFLVC